jgi:hypothetical protein
MDCDFYFRTNCLKWIYNIALHFDEKCPGQWDVEVEILDDSYYGICIRNDLPSLFRTIGKNPDKSLNTRKNLHREIREFIIKHCESNYDRPQPNPNMSIKNTICPKRFQARVWDTTLTSFFKYRYAVSITASTCWSCEKTHNVTVYKECINLSIIEDDIRPLVLALNSIESIQTEFSCQGHLIHYPRRPFVKFYSSSLNQIHHLRDVLKDCKTGLTWTLKGLIKKRKILWEITSVEKKTLFDTRLFKKDILILSKAITPIV